MQRLRIVIRQIYKVLYSMVQLRVKKPLSLLRDYRLVRRSGLFDFNYYPQIVGKHADSLDPIIHYIAVGFQEGRNPNPLFDNRYYEKSNPDVLLRKMNPLVHYIIFGTKEGRKPHPLFDTEYYLQQYRELLPEGMNPLRHFLLVGPEEKRNPHPLFDTGYYLEEYPDVADSGLNPLVHYLRKGVEESRDPHPLFSTSYYLEKNPIVAEIKHNPLVHYLEEGALQGRNPHPLFQTTYYLSKYRDILDPKMNSLVHYLLIGVREGCWPNPLFDTKYYLDHNPDIRMNGINPLIHYLKRGYREHRNPSIRFNTDYYLSSNPDVTERGLHPLIHYLEYGYEEGRKPIRAYERWLQHHSIRDEDRNALKEKINHLFYRPLISVIVPVYNTDKRWLIRCVESVRGQHYPFWELCIADDASTRPHVAEVLKEYMAKDSRIKVAFREKNGNISACSNTALELATGEYIALLDHDDEFSEDALYETASLLNAHPDADMIYSDEDKVSEEGERFGPFFKPDWSPDTFLSQMYTCHLGVYRTKLIREIGGFRKGFDGSQDYDLVLRFTEKTQKIYHIPKILYHWRTIPGSAAEAVDAKGYAQEPALRALREALSRRGEEAEVEALPGGRYRARYYPRNNPLVSILIPTRDLSPVLAVCLTSLFEKTVYPHFEVLVIDNGSVEKETQNLFHIWQMREPARFRVIPADMPFNFSRLINRGAAEARGELLLIFNNDMEVMAGDWLSEMAGQAQRSSVGAVGAKLLYPDDTIQHGGVVLGIGGIAAHSHKYFPKDAPGYFGRLCIVSNYSAVTGACLMVRKSLFVEVGGFDEHLGVAFNDTDFCLRLRARGFHNVFLGHVVLRHHESKSRGLEDTVEKQIRFRGEIDCMLERWGEILENDPCYSPHLTLLKEDFSLRILDTGWVYEPGEGFSVHREGMDS